MPKKPPTAHLKRWQFTPESGREARLSQPLPPRTLHGLTEIVRTGRRRCRPHSCAKGATCPVARRPAEELPEFCSLLDVALARKERALRRSVNADPINLHLIAVVLRYEALLLTADMFLSEADAFSLEDGKVVAQPVLGLLAKIMGGQARVLRQLGVAQVREKTTAEVWAEALNVTVEEGSSHQAPQDPPRGCQGASSAATPAEADLGDAAPWKLADER